MNQFLTALRATGEPVRKSDLFGYLARLPREVEFESVTEGPFVAVAATGAETIRPLLGRFRHLIGAGDVRLDCREALLRSVGGTVDTSSDLQLVLAAIDARGPDIIHELKGDFALVVWDARAQKIVAARDAFGVKSLFMRRADGLLLFASRATTLATADGYNTDYLRDFLFGMPGCGQATAWQDVQRVEAGTVFQQRGTAGTVRTYWSAHDFQPAAER